MNERGLRETYESLKPGLEAWGSFVVGSVIGGVRVRLPASQPIEYFLKLWPVQPRVKETESLVSKALRRGKRYEEPLSGITDMVGARFVVLLIPEIRLIEEVITSSSEWSYELARDFAEERRQKPLYFDYQSLHYVVRSKVEREIDGIHVPAGTSCELQVRTLLQHAYSELAHDTIYKPKAALDTDDPELSRHVARSMALIETSDMIFEQVARAIEKAGADLRDAIERATTVYSDMVGEPKSLDSRLSEFILAPFRRAVPLISLHDLKQVLESRPFLIDFIRDNHAKYQILQTPIILIVLCLIMDDEEKVWREWPVDQSILEEIFAHLGISWERY